MHDGLSQDEAHLSCIVRKLVFIFSGCPVLLFFLFFPIFSKLPIYSYILSKSPIFLAHLSRRLIGEFIGYPWIRRPSSSLVVVVRLFTFSNVFSSETACGASLGRGTKVCINGPGHMTKMAAMPIYGKNLKKSSSPEPAGRFPRNLVHVCSIGDSCPS